MGVWMGLGDWEGSRGQGGLGKGWSSRYQRRMRKMKRLTRGSLVCLERRSRERVSPSDIEPTNNNYTNIETTAQLEAASSPSRISTSLLLRILTTGAGIQDFKTRTAITQTRKKTPKIT